MFDKEKATDTIAHIRTCTKVHQPLIEKWIKETETILLI